MIWAISSLFPDYEVSDEGEVRRLTPARGARAGAICKPYVDKDGRVTVSLRCAGKTKTVRVATLVCTAFVGPKPAGRFEVCHGNGDPGSNRWDNLRWDTSKSNKADMVQHGTRLARGKHPLARLSESDVQDIRKRYAAGERQKALAAEFKVAQGQISRICTGARW